MKKYEKLKDSKAKSYVKSNVFHKTQNWTNVLFSIVAYFKKKCIFFNDLKIVFVQIESVESNMLQFQWMKIYKNLSLKVINVKQQNVQINQISIAKFITRFRVIRYLYENHSNAEFSHTVRNIYKVVINHFDNTNSNIENYIYYFFFLKISWVFNHWLYIKYFQHA